MSISTRIGIVDDHPAFVLGASSILNSHPDFQVVATSPTAAGLVRERIRLDIVLLDLVLSDDSCPAENMAALSAYSAPVLVLTTRDDGDLVRSAMQAGAIGTLAKCEPAARIVDVVRRASMRDDAGRPAGPSGLTFRETEVLALYAGGGTAEQVAASLYITRETVHDHIRRIRVKYSAAGRPAHTKVDLYCRAVEDGIVATQP